ncbi:MAG: cadherin-like beta sandwich domain-containing protein [Ruminococcus sp.]|nr:cadherin-like beta sandwich domain-containing protein [Ruminococcus sp.]
MIIKNKLAAALAMLLLLILCGAGSICASAEGGAVITVSAEAEQGSTVEVILTFSADSPIGSVETNIAYDESRLTYTEGEATGGCGVLHLHDFPDTETDTFSLTLKFTADDPGTAEIQLKNCVISSPEGVPLASPEASASVSIKESSGEQTTLPDSSAEDSSEAPEVTTVVTDESGVPVKGVLRSLSVSEGLLLPEFSPLIYDYTVKINSSLESLGITAEKTDITDEIWFKCSTWFDGDVTLTNANVHIVEDETRVYITVTDEEGRETVYKLLIQKIDESSYLPSESSMPETTVTTAAPEIPAEVTDTTPDSSSSSDPSEKSGVSELRDKLMPALIIILATLVLALVIIIAWLRSRSSSRRKRIRQSGGKK